MSSVSALAFLAIFLVIGHVCILLQVLHFCTRNKERLQDMEKEYEQLLARLERELGHDNAAN